jgi:hypothetical protein
MKLCNMCYNKPNQNEKAYKKLIIINIKQNSFFSFKGFKEERTVKKRVGRRRMWLLEPRGIHSGVSKGVEDGCGPPALWVGHP